MSVSGFGSSDNSMYMFIKYIYILQKKSVINSLTSVMTSEGASPSEALIAELEQVKTEIPKLDDVRLIAAVPQLVRSEIL